MRLIFGFLFIHSRLGLGLINFGAVKAREKGREILCVELQELVYVRVTFYSRREIRKV